ncbi:gp53-like domain-containing protein [Selenomonas montiformis]
MLLGELHNSVYSLFPTVQWGTYAITTAQWKEYSFPIAFSNTCYGVVTTPFPNAGTGVRI